MKKKILSILTMICLIFPSFFVVACKAKDTPQSVSPYAYSIVLKNAKGKIDSSSLAQEYDYKKDENVAWTEDGDDYKISVTKGTALSGSITFNLLEGYDYSNLTLKVNDQNASFEVLSGGDVGAEKLAYLKDRQVKYSYTKMKTNTTIEFDFASCNWAKVTIDMSEVNDNTNKDWAQYSIIGSDYVSLKDSSSLEFSVVRDDEDTIEVDYGTTVAIAAIGNLVQVSSSGVQNLSVSTFGSKYFTKQFGDKSSREARVQYLTATKDCKILNSSASLDETKKQTLRMLSVGDVSIFASFDFYENNSNKLNPVSEIERYDDESLEVLIASGEKLYIELTVSDWENYLYYLIDTIDTKIQTNNKIEAKVYGDTTRHYLEIDLSETTGAKYLVRQPKNSSDYFLVSAENIGFNARMMNASFILVGEENNKTSIYSDTIMYGYKKSDDVEIFVNNTQEDVATNASKKLTSVFYEVRNEDNQYTNSNTEDLSTSKTLTIDCKSDENQPSVCQIKFSYTKQGFTNETLNISRTKLKHYDGEKVFVTTDISNNDSWTELDNTGKFEFSSANGQTLYYYFVSDREDAGLQIVDDSNSTVSLSGELKDCFGRKLSGKVTVQGYEIDLSKIQYLELDVGYYTTYTAYLVREFDATSHSVSSQNLGEGVEVMVSLNGSTNEQDFVPISELGGLEIKSNSEIYYYIKSSYGIYFQLQNSENKIVGDSKAVVIGDNQLKIDNNCVYRLSLNGGWYLSGEVFYLKETSGEYFLRTQLGEAVELYSDNSCTQPVSEMKVGTSYFFKGDADDSYCIEDAGGNKVITNINFAKDGTTTEDDGETKTVYGFLLKFEYNNYPDGEIFTLRLINQTN